jgi:hypothetical protein
MTMKNILDRVARFADIDTRRALGYLPRRLPPSALRLPERVNYPHGTSVWLKHHTTHLFVGSDILTWVFRCGQFTEMRVYCYHRNGTFSFYSPAEKFQTI